VSQNESQWRAWYETEAAEDEPIPGHYERWTSAFERLLVVRCWRPDRAVHESHKYIRYCLGDEYVERCELDLVTLARDNDCRSPLVGLISATADPTSGIEAAAKKLKIGEPISRCISVIFAV